MEIKKEYMGHMKEIFRALPGTFFIKDTEGKYVFTTKICDMVNAGPEGTIIGKTDAEIQIDKKLGMRYYEEDMDIVRTGSSTHTIDAIELEDQTVYIEVLKKPIHSDDREIIGICGVCNDVSELVSLQKKYEQLGVRDSLTGLYNRNYAVKFDFDQEASLPCSYIVCDCNGLKQVNDYYGHDVGDRYICETARMLKKTVPARSTVVRWGGDEFLVITPSCKSWEQEKLLRDVREAQGRLAEKIPGAGVAVGGALRTDLGISEAEMVKQADARMYADKAASKLNMCQGL